MKEGDTLLSEPKKKNEWIEWGKAILITILLALLLKTFVLSMSIVEGESMDPTLADGDRIIFNKFVYLIGKPDRGDVIIIQRPLKNYVKRIIALPGETIEMKNHTLYINNEKFEQMVLTKDAVDYTGSFGPIEIPEDNFFVMGDNRAISKDSRNGLGLINRDEVIGRSEFIVYPFSDWAMTR